MNGRDDEVGREGRGRDTKGKAIITLVVRKVICKEEVKVDVVERIKIKVVEEDGMGEIGIGTSEFLGDERGGVIGENMFPSGGILRTDGVAMCDTTLTLDPIKYGHATPIS